MATRDDARILAKVAIVLGLCVAPVFLIIGFLTAGLTGFAGVACQRDDCRTRIHPVDRRSDRCLDIGLFGGGLVISGVVALLLLPRPVSVALPTAVRLPRGRHPADPDPAAGRTG